MWKQFTTFALALVSLNSMALPILTESEDGSGLLATIYPDHDDHNKVYFLPNTGSLEKGTNNQPRFGMSYWTPTTEDASAGYFSGIFRLGISGDLQTSINSQLKAGRKVAVIPVQKSHIEFMTDSEGNRVNEDLFKEASVASRGGRAEDSIGISGTLTRIGSMALRSILSEDGQGADLKYCYEITGVSPVFHAKIRLNYHKVFQHFLAQASGGRWWWKWSIRTEVEKLVERGDIKIEINGGEAKQYDYIMAVADRMVEKFMVPKLENRRNSASGKYGISYTYIAEDREMTYELKQREIINRDFCVSLGMGELKAYPWLITNAEKN